MTPDVPSVDAAPLAERVRAAIDTGDLDAFRDLLAPNARWGSGEYPDSGCTNRDEILRYYLAGRTAGRRGTVTEVAPGDGTLLVGLSVTGLDGDDVPVQRWQVLTVRSGQIVDIRGYEDRALAEQAAGFTV